MQPQSQPLDHTSARNREVTILAVDDYSVFREALRDMISAAPGFVLIGEACSGEEALSAVARLLPELVVMDVVMPGMGGIAAARSILERHPGIAVALISVDDPSLHRSADTLGDAVACIRKQDLSPERLRQVWEAHRN